MLLTLLNWSKFVFEKSVIASSWKMNLHFWLAIHTSNASGYPTCQMPIVGRIPIPHWLQKFLLQLRVLQTLSVRVKANGFLIFGWKCQTITTTKQNIRAEPSEMRARTGSISMARSHKVVKGRTLNVNGVGYFRDKPVKQSVALAETDSGPAGWGWPLWSRDGDHQGVIQCGYQSSLWRGSGWCESSREQGLFCSAVWVRTLWIKGKDKTESSSKSHLPKDPFRIAADRNSFG